MKIERFADVTTINPLMDEDGNKFQAYQSCYTIEGTDYYTIIKKDDFSFNDTAATRIKIEAEQLEKYGFNRDEAIEAIYEHFRQAEFGGRAA